MALQKDGSDEGFLSDDQWIAAWKQDTPQVATPVMRTPGVRKLRPRYDSAVEAHGAGSGGLGKGGDKAAAAAAASETVAEPSQAQPTGKQQAYVSSNFAASRTASERLLDMVMRPALIHCNWPLLIM